MPKENDIAVRVSNVSKSFKLPHESQNSLKGKLINFNKRGFEVQHALKDISFEVKKGEFFGIVGRNGGGKSTLLKLISGIYTPDEGSIEVHGKLTPFIELGVGFNPELSGRDNVYLNGALLGFSRKEMDELYDSIVEFAEIERFMDQKLKNYSSGMQVRLAFSIAIRAQTDVLILDEVLAVGDAAFQQKCFDYFEDLKQKKKTIIFVTHDMDSVRRFCDRALMLADGEILTIGDPRDISDEYLEANIKRQETPSVHEEEQDKLSVRLLSKKSVSAGDPVRLNVAYTAEDDEEHYIGISLQFNGIALGELNSKRAFSLPKGRGNKSVDLSLDTTYLNGGQYDIGVAVFNRRNSSLLYFKTRALSFGIKGKDETVGGALKLAVRWSDSGEA